jgi:hypothetical protein
LRESNPSVTNRPDFPHVRVGEVRGFHTLQDAYEVLCGRCSHLCARLNAGTGDVGRNDDVVQPEEGAAVADGLLLEDVEGSAGYGSVSQGSVEGVLVDDGSP